jgi:two-component system phosphate regulon sensor histidine kinase PhoR
MAQATVPGRLGLPPARLGLSVAQILLPATVALVLLGYLDTTHVHLVLAAWIVAALASVALASLRERRLQATRIYLNELAEARQPPPPPSLGPLIDDGLDSVFRRLARTLTERRERVLEADRLLGVMLEALPDPLILVADGRLVIRANRAAANLFGVRLAERTLESSVRDPSLLAAVDDALHRGSEAQVTLQLAGIAVRAFSAQIVPVQIQGRPAALVSLRELTEQLMIERMRSDFIANASHEIRTPLAAIIGFTETLQGPARDDPVAREQFLATMLTEARRMNRLVNDLLSLSQIESSAHQVPATRVDLKEALDTVTSILSTYAEKRQTALEVEVGTGEMIVRADRDQLIQLMTNLVDNAIKYGGEGRPVAVSLERCEAAPPGAGPLTGRPAIRFLVRDRGPGIAREHLPRLTERFFRIDTARSRALGGTGLGLAIVKHILRRHRGHLQVESELGHGTEVTAWLPA